MCSFQSEWNRYEFCRQLEFFLFFFFFFFQIFLNLSLAYINARITFYWFSTVFKKKDCLLYKIRKWWDLQTDKTHYIKKILYWWYIHWKGVCLVLSSVFKWLCLLSKSVFFCPIQLPVEYTEAIFEIIKNKYTNRTRIKNDSGITCISWIHIHACIRGKC